MRNTSLVFHGRTFNGMILGEASVAMQHLLNWILFPQARKNETGLTGCDFQKTTVQKLKAARQVKVVALQNRLRLFKAELGEKIGPLDPYWLSFGLNKPGAKARPDAPTNITAVSIGNNAISVKWDKAPRAAYYRVWKRVVGAEPELLIAGSPADLDFIHEGLPTISIVEIAVSAMNDGGESAKSAIISVQTLCDSTRTD